MTLLITGICGFAGSQLARSFLEHRPDLHIIGLDNLSRRGSETNLEPLRALGIDVRVGDVRDRDALAELPRVDWVLDCAANPSVLAGVTPGASSSFDLLDHNLFGTVYLLELCKRDSAGFTLLSTSRVYAVAPLSGMPLTAAATRFSPDEEKIGGIGGLSRDGVSEQFSTQPPLSLYGNSKLCSELLALEYGHCFDFPVRINRCGVLAGAGQFGKADQGIFSFWIHSWRANRALRFVGFDGSGRQVRDALHPRDLAALLLRQIDFNGTLESPICNFSGGLANSLSLRELSDWCADRFGGSLAAGDPRFVEELPTQRPFDVPWLVLDSRQAGAVWDWTPTTPVHDILEEIARHAETHPQWLDQVS